MTSHRAAAARFACRWRSCSTGSRSGAIRQQQRRGRRQRGRQRRARRQLARRQRARRQPQPLEVRLRASRRPRPASHRRSNLSSRCSGARRTAEDKRTADTATRSFSAWPEPAVHWREEKRAGLFFTHAFFDGGAAAEADSARVRADALAGADQICSSIRIEHSVLGCTVADRGDDFEALA